MHHFVSDSNADPLDVGGKFKEALDKMIAWVDENDNPETEAVRMFKALNESGRYPGLGTVKKLSIMNHIELVMSII